MSSEWHRKYSVGIGETHREREGISWLRTRGASSRWKKAEERFHPESVQQTDKSDYVFEGKALTRHVQRLSELLRVAHEEQRNLENENHALKQKLNMVNGLPMPFLKSEPPSNRPQPTVHPVAQAQYRVRTAPAAVVAGHVHGKGNTNKYRVRVVPASCGDASDQSFSVEASHKPKVPPAWMDVGRVSGSAEIFETAAAAAVQVHARKTETAVASLLRKSDRLINKVAHRLSPESSRSAQGRSWPD